MEGLALLCLFMLLALLQGVSAGGDMSYHVLSPPRVAAFGAACLDGSAPSFYVNTTESDRWVIYFQGGGWCYNEIQCLGRSKTALGTSNGLSTTMTGKGMLSHDPVVNPEFFNANRVFIHYCDGGSYSGDVEGPVVVNGSPIHFRGLHNFHAIIDELLSDFGLNTATEVLLSGCSAGGLAAYLHADDLAQLLPRSVTKYAVAPASGMFIDHPNVNSNPVYTPQLVYVFLMQNSTRGVNQNCIEAGQGAECILAQNAYAHLETPVFVQNSVLDSWSLKCILGAAPEGDLKLAPKPLCNHIPGFQACGSNYEKCTPSQTQTLINWDESFQNILSATATFSKKGNGAFLHTCVTHCASFSPYWNSFKVNGVAFYDAFNKWWKSDFMQPASQNTHVPECSLSMDPPHKCNPTCPA